MHKVVKVLETMKPSFSIASVVCVVASIPMARLGAELFSPKEDYLGYGGLGVAIAVLVISLSSGLILGLVGLWRSEKPRILPISATLINASAIIWLVANKPG